MELFSLCLISKDLHKHPLLHRTPSAAFFPFTLILQDSACTSLPLGKRTWARGVVLGGPLFPVLPVTVLSLFYCNFLYISSLPHWMASSTRKQLPLYPPPLTPPDLLSTLLHVLSVPGACSAELQP